MSNVDDRGEIMTDKPMDLIFDSLAIEKGDLLYELMDFAYDMMPYVGKINQYYKFKRLEKRLRNHDELLFEIRQLLEESPHLPYYKEQVFPLFFEDIFNEHEDKKIKYILSGFKNIIQANSTEEEEYLTLFDTLRELRAHEVLLLIVRAKRSIDEFKNSFCDAVYSEGNKIIIGYVDSKLDRLGLTNPIVSVQGRGFFTYYGIAFVRFLNDYENIAQSTSD